MYYARGPNNSALGLYVPLPRLHRDVLTGSVGYHCYGIFAEGRFYALPVY